MKIKTFLVAVAAALAVGVSFAVDPIDYACPQSVSPDTGLVSYDAEKDAFLIGMPKTKETVLRLPGGKTFTIRANRLWDPYKYIGRVRLNDITLGGKYLLKADLLAGGTLNFDMDRSQPKKQVDHERFTIQCDHADGVYKLGEETVFTVRCHEPDGSLAKPGVSVKVDLNNFGDIKYDSYTIDTAKEGNPFKIRAKSPEEPGSLKINVSQVGGGGSGFWTVIYDPFKIRQGHPCPDDFDTFWREARAKYDREVPVSTIKATPGKLPFPNWDFYEVEIPFMGGKSYYLYLYKPQKIEGKRLPLRFGVPGAGPGGQGGNHPGFICACFNVHPWKVPAERAKAQEILSKVEAELAKKYGRTHFGYYSAYGLSESREAGYYYGAILAGARALDWLVQQPYVDASNVIYRGGSQGGGFGLYLSGLTPHITDLRIDVPALTDLNGSEAKRACGWPYIVWSQATKEQNDVAAKNTPYYDACNFAARCQAKRVRCSVGLIDFTCPPTCVLSAYNNIPTADKVMFFGVGMPHWPTFDDTIGAFWENADKGGAR